MYAVVGDHIEVRGRHVAEKGRRGKIVEVHGAGGQPPYVVRWSDGHENLFFPGPDAVVQHMAHPATP